MRIKEHTQKNRFEIKTRQKKLNSTLIQHSFKQMCTSFVSESTLGQSIVWSHDCTQTQKDNRNEPKRRRKKVAMNGKRERTRRLWLWEQFGGRQTDTVKRSRKNHDFASRERRQMSGTRLIESPVVRPIGKPQLGSKWIGRQIQSWRTKKCEEMRKTNVLKTIWNENCLKKIDNQCTWLTIPKLPLTLIVFTKTGVCVLREIKISSIKDSRWQKIDSKKRKKATKSNHYNHKHHKHQSTHTQELFVTMKTRQTVQGWDGVAVVWWWCWSRCDSRYLCASVCLWKGGTGKKKKVRSFGRMPPFHTFVKTFESNVRETKMEEENGVEQQQTRSTRQSIHPWQKKKSQEKNWKRKDDENAKLTQINRCLTTWPKWKDGKNADARSIASQWPKWMDEWIDGCGRGADMVRDAMKKWSFNLSRNFNLTRCEHCGRQRCSACVCPTLLTNSHQRGKLTHANIRLKANKLIGFQSKQIGSI